MPRLRKKVEPEIVSEPVVEVPKAGQRKPRKKKVEDEQPEPIQEVQAVEPEPIKKTRKRSPKPEPVPEPEPIPEVVPVKRERKIVVKKEKPIGRQKPVEVEPVVEPVKVAPKAVVKKERKVVVKKPAPVIIKPEKKLTPKQIEKAIEREKNDDTVPQVAPKKVEHFMVEATPSTKKSDDKYISIKENANADERKLMSDKIQKNEVVFSHYAIDNEHGVHYYRVLTKNK